MGIGVSKSALAQREGRGASLGQGLASEAHGYFLLENNGDLPGGLLSNSVSSASELLFCPCNRIFKAV